MMNLLLLSNSTNYKEPYLGWCIDLILQFLKSEEKNILFFPYAGVKVGGKDYPDSYDSYTERVVNIFKQYNLSVTSIHQASDPVLAVEEADVIMVGGGNTFHLAAEIHKHKLIEPVRRKVIAGTPFIGWSAGSNVASPTLRTTNDMPIIMPESFDCFHFIPFQINPHYLDPYPEDVNDAIRHGGETRQDRINEFLAVNPDVTVVGLREGTALWVQNDLITLKGTRNLRVMKYEQPEIEIIPETQFDFEFNLK